MQSNALVLASSTFNNTDQLKLLGFTNLTHVLIDRRCSILVRAFLYDHKIKVTEIDAFNVDLGVGHDIYLFHDNHGNSNELLTFCDKLRARNANIFIFESPLIDARSGFRPY